MKGVKKRLFLFTFINFSLSYFLAASAITLFMVIYSHYTLFADGANEGALSFVFKSLYVKWFFLLCFPFLLYFSQLLNFASPFVLRNKLISLLTFTWVPLIFVLRIFYLILTDTGLITLNTLMLYLPLFTFLFLQIVFFNRFRARLIAAIEVA